MILPANGYGENQEGLSSGPAPRNVSTNHMGKGIV